MVRLKGILMIVIGSMLWGATGPLIEWILVNTKLSASFMLSLRLMVAGVALLLFLKIKGEKITLIWRQPYWSKQVILFSIFGMLGVQFAFVAAIKESNAVLATLLQFLAPIFVVAFVSLRIKRWPPRYQLLGISGTLFGLFLLLTNASLDVLLISKEALIWGVVLGLTFAFYTLYPVRLMKEWGVLLVVGWGMFIGGVVIASFNQIWKSGEWILLKDGKIVLLLAALIFFGTIAFLLFLGSMKYISPVETSILSSVEPLTAMIISIFAFGTILGVWQILGVALMLVCVTYLSIAGEK